jgi:hypothetical protein
MYGIDIYGEDLLRTEAAAYPCGICPPEFPCYELPSDGDNEA